MDQSSEAVRLVSEALELTRAKQPILAKLAEISCQECAGAKAAEQHLVAQLASGHDNASILNFIGAYALLAKQFDKLRKNLQSALRLEPQNPITLNNLTLAMARSPAPDLAAALQVAETGLAILPENPDLRMSRGEVLVGLNRWDEAEAELRFALQFRENSRDLRGLLIKVCEQKQDADEAEEHRAESERILAED